MGVTVIHTGGTTPPPKPKAAPGTASPAPAMRLWARARPWLPWVLVAVLALALACVLTAWLLGPDGGAGPAPDIDAKFRAIGREYGPLLEGEYAAALRDGAKILDAGQPIATAITTVQKAWEANRQAGLAAKVTPELSRIIDQGTAEKDVTPEMRARLAAAWRGLAAGVEGK